MFGIIVNTDLNPKDQRFLWQPHCSVACLNMTYTYECSQDTFFNSVLCKNILREVTTCMGLISHLSTRPTSWGCLHKVHKAVFETSLNNNHNQGAQWLKFVTLGWFFTLGLYPPAALYVILMSKVLFACNI